MLKKVNLNLIDNSYFFFNLSGSTNGDYSDSESDSETDSGSEDDRPTTGLNINRFLCLKILSIPSNPPRLSFRH